MQITTDEGLCTDDPHFIGYDDAYNRVYIGGDGATICYLDYVPLERWPYDYPSPMWGLPGWFWAEIPHLQRVTGGAAFHAYAPGYTHVPTPEYAAYNMPTFVGSGGQCILDGEGQWHCLTTADGLPFDDIRGYGVAWVSNVEWFMSADSVASRGLQPADQHYAIPELVGAAEARPTWMCVPRSDEEGIWIATNGYGVIHAEPSQQRVTRYTAADGLPDDDVRDVQCSDEQGVWVATAGGVGHWDGQRWKAYTVDDGLPSNDVRGVSTDRPYIRYGVWAATAGGPAFMSSNAEKWQSFPNFPAGIEVNGVLYGDFSTRGQGLVRFIRSQVTHGRTTLFTTADGLPSDQITALAATDRGILVGTPRGAVEWDGQTWTPITTEAVNDASSTTIATESGLWIRDGGTWEKVTDERVVQVAEGGWYATAGQVCRWVGDAPECLTTDEGQPLVGVYVLYADPEEGICAAIDTHEEQWIYDPAAGDSGRFVPWPISFSPHLVNDAIVRPGAWQYATERGVYHAPCDDYGCDAFGDFRLAGGWAIPIRQIYWNRATKQIWVATSQGAYYEDSFDPSNEPGWIYVAGLPSRDLTTVLALPGGDAWFGTTDAGVIHFEPAAP